MELTHADVTEILDLVQRSGRRYVEVQYGGTRIRCGAPPATGPAATPERSAPDGDGAGAHERNGASVDVSGAARPTAGADRPEGQGAADGGPQPPPGAFVVHAPMVGTFYRAPEPGAPPYAAVGREVVAGTTLGLVEAMKTFNSVVAEVSGVVVGIYAEDSAFVEYGQPLVAIDPQS